LAACSGAQVRTGTQTGDCAHKPTISKVAGYELRNSYAIAPRTMNGIDVWSEYAHPFQVRDGAAIVGENVADSGMAFIGEGRIVGGRFTVLFTALRFEGNNMARVPPGTTVPICGVLYTTDERGNNLSEGSPMVGPDTNWGDRAEIKLYPSEMYIKPR